MKKNEREAFVDDIIYLALEYKYGYLEATELKEKILMSLNYYEIL